VYRSYLNALCFMGQHRAVGLMLRIKFSYLKITFFISKRCDESKILPKMNLLWEKIMPKTMREVKIYKRSIYTSRCNRHRVQHRQLPSTMRQIEVNQVKQPTEEVFTVHQLLLQAEISISVYVKLYLFSLSLNLIKLGFTRTSLDWQIRNWCEKRA